MTTLPIFSISHQKQWTFLQESGLSSSPNQGYDVIAPISPSRKAQARQSANGYLSDGTFYWPLFVSNVNIDIALAGSTAQSLRTRDFYPRNFIQPNFTIQGQALDQEDYGTLCEYVLRSQRILLRSWSGSAGKPQPLIQLNINAYGSDGTRKTSVGVTYQNKLYPNQIIRGSHSPLVAQGYVSAMPREHQKSVYAPTYTLTFVVARMIQGPWSETLVDTQNVTTQSAQPGIDTSFIQPNWVQIVMNAPSTTSTKANIAQAKSYLDYAAKNAGNIINTGG